MDSGVDLDSSQFDKNRGLIDNINDAFVKIN